MKIIVKVQGMMEQGRHEASTPFRKTYKGEELAVWCKIAEAHGYGFEQEEVAEARAAGKTDEQIATNVRNGVLESNGDGCDFLSKIQVSDDGGKNWETLFEDDSEVEDEEVEC